MSKHAPNFMPGPSHHAPDPHWIRPEHEDPTPPVHPRVHKSEHHAPVQQASSSQSSSPSPQLQPSVGYVSHPAPAPVTHSDQSHHPRGKVLRRIGCWGFLLAFAVIVVVTVMPAKALVQAYGSASEAQKAVRDAQGYVAAEEFGSAARSVALARAKLVDARHELEDVGFWRDVPGIGTQIRGMEDASSAADQALDAAHDVLDAADAISQAFQTNPYAEIDPTIAPKRSYADLSLEEKRDVLNRLNNALPIMRVARDKAVLAVELWERVPQDRLVQPLMQALQPLADGLPAMKAALEESVPLIEAGLPFAGFPNTMRYLLLFQNSDEIRPTGGFIGSLGVVTMDSGDLKELAFSDVYTVDMLAFSTWKDVPPGPIAKKLGVKAWFLRDSNWSPDFPTSAVRILDVFQRETSLSDADAPPTAVIAFTPAFFKSVLELTGPVTVNGQTYAADDFFDKIQYEVEQGFLKNGTKLEDRKKSLGALGDAVMEKLKHLPSSQWGNALGIVATAFAQKQVQAFAEDPRILSTLDRQNWSGRAKSTIGDFVWVVDANLAALKTDGVMRKEISYHLDAKRHGDAPIATVTLDYTNENKKIDWRYTRYRSYTRVYVPEGSELVSYTGVDAKEGIDVFKELGKTVFGTFWTIEPGESGTLSYTYRLPESMAGHIADGTYRLDWPKQAGADKTQLTLDLNFDKNIGAANPAETQERWGDARYQIMTDSLVDRIFTLKLKP